MEYYLFICLNYRFSDQHMKLPTKYLSYSLKQLLIYQHEYYFVYFYEDFNLLYRIHAKAQLYSKDVTKILTFENDPSSSLSGNSQAMVIFLLKYLLNKPSVRCKCIFRSKKTYSLIRSEISFAIRPPYADLVSLFNIIYLFSNFLSISSLNSLKFC